MILGPTGVFNLVHFKSPLAVVNESNARLSSEYQFSLTIIVFFQQQQKRTSDCAHFQAAKLDVRFFFEKYLLLIKKIDISICSNLVRARNL